MRAVDATAPGNRIMNAGQAIQRKVPRAGLMWTLSACCAAGVAVAGFWPGPTSGYGPGPTYLFETWRPLNFFILTLTGVSSIAFATGIMASARSGRKGFWELGTLTAVAALITGVVLFVFTLTSGPSQTIGGVIVVVQAYPQPMFLAGWGFISLICVLVFWGSSPRTVVRSQPRLVK